MHSPSSICLALTCSLVFALLPSARCPKTTYREFGPRLARSRSTRFMWRSSPPATCWSLRDLEIARTLNPGCPSGSALRSCQRIGSAAPEPEEWPGAEAAFNQLGHVLQCHGASARWTRADRWWHDSVRPFFMARRKPHCSNREQANLLTYRAWLHGRWYPTLLTLGDARVMTFSGLKETGGTNSTVEFYTIGSGWSTQYPAGWAPDLYPRLHLLPNGKSSFGCAAQVEAFRSCNYHLDHELRHYELRWHAHLWHICAAAADPSQQLRLPRSSSWAVATQPLIQLKLSISAWLPRLGSMALT